eukprot:1924500-Pyramimonas_sp.AAC.1
MDISLELESTPGQTTSLMPSVNFQVRPDHLAYHAFVGQLSGAACACIAPVAIVWSIEWSGGRRLRGAQHRLRTASQIQPNPPPKACAPMRWYLNVELGARVGFAGVEGAPGQSQVARQVLRAVAYHAAGD